MAKSISPSTSDKTDHKKEVNNNLVLSYQTLRNLIGFSGLLLPLALIRITTRAGADRYIEPSISHYFYTSNGDVLVVILCIIGVFLFTHQGYNKWDKFWNSLAGLSAIGIAFNPTRSEFPREAFSIHTFQSSVTKILGVELHFIFAILFFISIAYITLFLFTKSQKGDTPSAQKLRRNKLFYISGYFIVFCIVCLAIYFQFNEYFDSILEGFPIVFVLEAFAVEAFALSFLTKGETFFPDGTHYLTKGIDDAKTTINKALK